MVTEPFSCAELRAYKVEWFRGTSTLGSDQQHSSLAHRGCLYVFSYIGSVNYHNAS
jgi:hypothetical protein